MTEGVLVPFGDSQAMAHANHRAVAGPHATSRHAEAGVSDGPGNGLEQGGGEIHGILRACPAKSDQPVDPAAGRPNAGRERLELPHLRMDHLMRMSDSTGMYQHANYSLPDFSHGYCTDDNARALITTVLLEELEVERPELHRLAETYASFMQYAFDATSKRFRNFMGYDRRWLEDEGSEDSQGRALWALGTCRGPLETSAFAGVGGPVVRACAAFRAGCEIAPRLGFHASRHLRIFPAIERRSRGCPGPRDVLTQRLIDLFEATAGDDWPWFEDSLSYANARLSQVLILSGRWADNAHSFEIGLKSLRWLVSVQKAPLGHFRPIGSAVSSSAEECRRNLTSNPSRLTGRSRPVWKPIAPRTIPFWHEQASIAFEWFLGRNDLGLSLYDSKTGGCRDGLHTDRVNQNQGAESTLAYLIALSEMQLLEHDLKAFQKPTDHEAEALKAHSMAKA